MFRVATYNIQKGVGLDVRRRPERILDVIAEFDPDILALQEADRRFGDRRSALPFEMIESRTDLKVVPIATRPSSIGWHGNAILVRRSIDVLKQQRLHFPMLEPRGAVMAEIRVHGALLRVVAMHLGLIGAVRRRQVASLLTQLTADGKGIPTVILGDFNEWRRSGGNLDAFQSHHRIVTPGHTFPSVAPLASLDRIITGLGISVEMSGVHRSRKAKIASDHLPVWAQLSL